MTEQEARDWLAERGWLTGGAGDRLQRLADLVVEENTRQNLIAASTIPHIWTRHIVDSAQLLPLVGNERLQDHEGLWVDIGSGGGFPGLVAGCLASVPLLLVETRPLRVEFLRRCVTMLGLSHVEVVQGKVEQLALARKATIISARAVAALPKLFTIGAPVADAQTLWLLPKGRNAEIELASARKEWQAVFHVEQSITDPDSAIIIASDLRSAPSQRPAKARSGRFSRSRKA